MIIEDGFIILDDALEIDDPNLKDEEYGDSPSCWFLIDDNEHFFKRSIYHPLEPYYEVFTSRVIEAIGISTVKYHLAKFKGQIGVISLNYNTNHEKEITIAEVLKIFLNGVACKDKSYPHSLGELNNLDMMWEAIDYYYRNRDNHDEIAKNLMASIVDAFLLQFLVGNIDLNLFNISIIDRMIRILHQIMTIIHAKLI